MKPQITNKRLSISLFKGIILFIIVEFVFLTNQAYSQPCDFYNTCRELSGGIFPDDPTLCEQVTDFSPDYTIANSAYASGLHLTTWNSGTAFYGKDILIQGVFYIDQPTAFYNCRIKLASGAQIIVQSQIVKNELLAFQCKFFSCDDMWWNFRTY